MTNTCTICEAEVWDSQPYCSDCALKRKKIEWLLRTYPAVSDPSNRGSQIGDGSSVILMPADFRRGSYAELENIIRVMRAGRTAAYFHMRHKYLICDCCYLKKTEIVRMVGKGKGVKPRCIYTGQYRLVEVHDIRGKGGRRVKLNDRKAAAGLDWLVGNWDRVNPGRQPFLPMAVAVAAGLRVERTQAVAA